MRHWVTVAVEEEAGLKDLGKLIQHLSAYFYADSVLIASKWVGRLQRAFGNSIDLFDRVDLRMNVYKWKAYFFNRVTPLAAY